MSEKKLIKSQQYTKHYRNHFLRGMKRPIILFYFELCEGKHKNIRNSWLRRKKAAVKKPQPRIEDEIDIVWNWWQSSEKLVTFSKIIKAGIPAESMFWWDHS